MRPACDRFPESRQIKWRINLIEPMGSSYRLQIDVPLLQLRQALTAALRAATTMGGYVYETPYRSFASHGEGRRTCIAMVFDRMPEDQYAFTWPLWDRLNEMDLTEVYVGWTTYYMLPSICYNLRAKSQNWYSHFRWAIQLIVAVGRRQWILSLRPTVNWEELYRHIDDYNNSFRHGDDEDLITKVEDSDGTLLYPLRRSGRITGPNPTAQVARRPLRIWHHLFLKLEIEGPHAVRAYQGKVEHFLRTAEAFLQQRGFNGAEVGGLG